MPQLSPTVSVLTGVAGQPPAVDGVKIIETCCGDWRWLTPTLPAGQQCQGEPEACRLIDAQMNELSDSGASHFAAGGGRWAAMLGGVCRSNFGLSGPDIQPLCGDATTGDIVCVSHRSEGRGLEIHRLTGDVVRLDVPLVYTDRGSIKGDLLTFAETFVGWRLYDLYTGLDVPLVVPEPIDWLVACRAHDGRVAVIERLAGGPADASLRVRLADCAKGLTVATYQGPQAATFNPDLVVLPDGTLTAAWCLNIQESPDSARTWTGTVDELAAVCAATPPDPPQPIRVQVRPGQSVIVEGIA